jgi:hypothetical protein
MSVALSEEQMANVPFAPAFGAGVMFTVTNAVSAEQLPIAATT